MKLDPRHLEILAAIVDKGGLTEGAMAVGKSQPSVSRTVTQLEARLGLSLFESNKRPLMPTEFCLQLAHYGRSISQAGQAASEFVTRFKRGSAGALRVAGSPIFMDGVVSPILAAFQSEYPDIRIEQGYGYAQEILDRLEADTLDLGIVPVRRQLVSRDIDVSQVLPGSNVIACRVGHPLTKVANLTPELIAEQSWIAPPPNSPLYHDLRGVFEGIGVEDIKVSFSGGTLSSILNVLSESDALTVLPYSVVYRLRRQNTLSSLKIAIGDPDRHLCILTSKMAPELPARARLTHYLKGELCSLHDLMKLYERNASVLT